MRATVFHSPFDAQIEQVSLASDASANGCPRVDHPGRRAAICESEVWTLYGPTAGSNLINQGGGWAVIGRDW